MKISNAHLHFKINKEFKSLGDPKVFSLDVSEAEFLLSHLPRDSFFTIGVHPWNIKSGHMLDQGLHERVLEFLDHPRCVGLGEMGLDGSSKHIEFLPLQEKFLSSFLENLVKRETKVELSIVWHLVRNFNKIEFYFNFLKENDLNCHHVIHDFSGSIPWAQDLLRKHNVHFSFSPRTLSRKLSPQGIPLENVLLESDDFEFDVWEQLQTSAQKWWGENCLEVINQNFIKVYPKTNIIIQENNHGKI